MASHVVDALLHSLCRMVMLKGMLKGKTWRGILEDWKKGLEKIDARVRLWWDYFIAHLI